MIQNYCEDLLDYDLLRKQGIVGDTGDEYEVDSNIDSPEGNLNVNNIAKQNVTTQVKGRIAELTTDESGGEGELEAGRHPRNSIGQRKRKHRVLNTLSCQIQKEVLPIKKAKGQITTALKTVNLQSKSVIPAPVEEESKTISKFIEQMPMPVSYTHLTLPTIYSV
eukprot:TRINITY_DN9048_c0_g1_i6.p1 TRINITY_DN9048_c0_g1~~TRINITY_DN9048_c0_g1_i6.p1  ORF type:complete len:165 (+),score=28.24 TRINITY_DN9048_c0_g1_i6:155-649(+)